MFVQDFKPVYSSTTHQPEVWDEYGTPLVEQTQSWHRRIAPHYNRLQDIIRSFQVDLPPESIAALRIELETSFRFVKSDPYSKTLFNVCWHLLNAISDVIMALDELVFGKNDSALGFIHAARVEMGFFDVELSQLGIS